MLVNNDTNILAYTYFLILWINYIIFQGSNEILFHVNVNLKMTSSAFVDWLLVVV